MLGPAGGRPPNEWSILVMDPVTTAVLASAVGMADVFERNVSLVDDLTKRREPQPSRSAVYFVSPCQSSVEAILADFDVAAAAAAARRQYSGSRATTRGPPPGPTYSKAYVFFSSPLPADLLARMRGSPGFLKRVRALKELNLEYFSLDGASFVTSQAGSSLRTLFGANAELSDRYPQIITRTARRLSTLFASLGETPAIRFRAPVPPADGGPPGIEVRALCTQRVAVELSRLLEPMRASGAVPAEPTCELLLLDRAVDVIAPAIHEFHYEAAARDLLAEWQGEGEEGNGEGAAAARGARIDATLREERWSRGIGGLARGLPPAALPSSAKDCIRGNIFVFESETQGGENESKETVLDSRDPLWVSLRHLHMAEASVKVSEELDRVLRSGAAAAAGAGRSGPSGGQSDMRALSRIARQLPEYRDRMARVAAQVELARRLNDRVDRRALVDLGRVEQGLVYGDQGSKELVAAIGTPAVASDPSPSKRDRARALLCYTATHPEKLDEARAQQWQAASGMSEGDVRASANLEFLGVPALRRARPTADDQASSLARRRRKAQRKERDGFEEQKYDLERFVPRVAELLDDAATGQLPEDEYPWVEPPDDDGSRAPEPQIELPTASSASFSPAAPSFSAPSQAAPRSVRTSATWARRGFGGTAGARVGSITDVVPDRTGSTVAPARVRSSVASASSLGSHGGSSLRGPQRPRRMVVFVLGGICWSEIRAAHRLSGRLGRDVLIGGTDILTPAEYMDQLEHMDMGPPDVFEIQ